MVYESDVLPHDVTIVGSFTASLKVSTSGARSGHCRYHTQHNYSLFHASLRLLQRRAMHLARPGLALDTLPNPFKMILCMWVAGTDSDFVVKLIDVYVPAPRNTFTCRLNPSISS